MGRIAIKAGTLAKDVEKVLELTRKRVRYIQIYGEVSSISANSSANLLDFEVPSGYGLEVFAIGVQPDFDPTDRSSGLEYVYPREGTTSKAIPNMEFFANFNYNVLPYGDRASKQPIRILDTPLKPNNLTLKFNEKEKFQLVGVAGSSAAGAVRAIAHAYLLEEADVRNVYGVGLSEFANLPGGHANLDQNFIYAKALSITTSGSGSFEDAKSIDVPNWLRIMLTHIGVKPDANSYKMKLYDEKTKIEFPDRDPYWVIKEVSNTLPFGSHNDEQPMQPLPPVVASYEWNNTTMHIYVMDTGSASSIKVQLLGIQRRVR